MSLSQVLPLPFASTWPDIANVDSRLDILREVFAEWFSKNSKSVLTKAMCFQMLAEAFEAETEEDFDPRSVGATESPLALIEILRRVYTEESDRHIRMRAFCHLRLMGADDRTFQQIADDLGFTTRATPSKEYRKIQRSLGGLPGRGDKSPVAREKYRLKRIGKKRERSPWTGFNAWKNHQTFAAA